MVTEDRNYKRHAEINSSVWRRVARPYTTSHPVSAGPTPTPSDLEYRMPPPPPPPLLLSCTAWWRHTRLLPDRPTDRRYDKLYPAVRLSTRPVYDSIHTKQRETQFYLMPRQHQPAAFKRLSARTATQSLFRPHLAPLSPPHVTSQSDSHFFRYHQYLTRDCGAISCNVCVPTTPLLTYIRKVSFRDRSSG